MFNLTHIIWIFLGAAFITSLFICTKKNIIKGKTPLHILMAVAVVSELIKMSGEFVPAEGGGMVLTPNTLPFQLCSIQIFLIYASYFMKDEKKLGVLESFMALTMLLGGTLAIFIPNYGTSFAFMGTYQYFIFHFSIVYYGLYLIFIKKINMGLKRYKSNILLLLLAFIFAIWINSFLQWGNTNFMYVVRPPMENLPILNLNNGWYVYILTLITVGLVLVSMFHLPFILKEKNIKKNNNAK